MDFHIDREVRFSTDRQHKNLYQWALQEYSLEGEKLSRDYIPWPWTLWFTATEVTVARSVKLSSTGDNDSTKKATEYSQRIVAKLTPGVWRDGFLDDDTKFSMFGTDRLIKDISISIYPLEDDGASEDCSSWGSVSYTTEVDFRDITNEDCLLFSLRLKLAKFHELLHLVQTQAVDQIELTVDGVAGCYSEWSPSISTNQVKVLTRDDEHAVILGEDTKIEPPRLGTINEFCLTFSRKSALAHRQLANQTMGVLTESNITRPDELTENSRLSAELLSQISSVEKAIARLRIPIWIGIALLVLLISK